MWPFDEQNRGNSLSFADRVGLLGSILSTIGEALGTIADVASIEEGRIEELEQQRQIDDLQAQIDELKEEQKTMTLNSEDTE